MNTQSQCRIFKKNSNSKLSNAFTKNLDKVFMNMLSRTVLLNNEPLALENGKDIPDIKPSVSTSEKSLLLRLPSGGIGFWVIPDLKLKSCMSHAEAGVDKTLLKRLTRRLEEDGDEEDAAHEELTDLPGELRSSLSQNRMRKHRKNRLGFDLEDDPLLKKFGIKRDLEKLEKLLNRRDIHDERKFRNLRYRGGFNIFENSDRGVSSKESTFKSKKNYNTHLGGEIMAKLEKYKGQLAEYENRKNNRATGGKKSFADGISESKDTDKAITALALISKVETALKGLQPNKSDIKFATLSRNSKLNPENDDDVLMDEVLKTDKAKRTIIPTKIEDQVEALSEFLSDKHPLLRRNTRKADYFTRNSPLLAPRIIQDLGRKLGEDPLSLRRDIFNKFYKTPEAKEPETLKSSKKGDDLPIFFDSKKIESGENFHGLSYQEPITGSEETFVRSPLERDLWMEEGLEPIDNFYDNFKDYGGLWEADSLQNYQNYYYDPRNWDLVTNAVKKNDYYDLKNIAAQPIPAPPTNFDQDIPITQAAHSITKKSRVRSIGEENLGLETMQLENNERENQNIRLKRELGDMNSLLNQEMFHQNDDECQCRVVREIGKSNDGKDLLVDPDVIIIDSKETIDHEEVIEDGSGAHVSEEVIEVVENSPVSGTRGSVVEKVKRDKIPKRGQGYGEVEKNLQDSSKTTESTQTLAIGQMPESREELNTSTVETNYRDTRDSIPSLRQLFRQAFMGKDTPTGENTAANSGGNSANGSGSKPNADDITNTNTKGSTSNPTESPETADKSSDESPGSAKKIRQTSRGPVLFPAVSGGSSGASRTRTFSDIIGSADEKKFPGATKFTLGVGEPVPDFKQLDQLRLPKLGERPNIGDNAAKLRLSLERAGADFRDRIPLAKPFGSLKRESIKSGGSTPAESLDPPKLGNPPKIRETAERLRHSIEKAGAGLRDRMPLKPLSSLKRESTKSANLTPTELLDVLKKARETRLATLKAIREEADKVRSKKAADALEDTLAARSARFEEFKKKRTEELQQLREKLREKRAEILKTYKPELLDVVKKNKEDLEKHVERREAGVKKIFDDLVETVDSNLNDKFPPVTDLFKPLHDLRKRKVAEKGDDGEFPNLGLLKFPDIFRSKKNVDDEDGVSSEEDENQRGGPFSNMKDNFPFTFFDFRPKEYFDPSDIYSPTKEDSKNVLEQSHHDQSYERSGSSEDKTWDFVDGRFRRIARSTESEDEEPEFTRRKRDTGPTIEETDPKNTAAQVADKIKISQESDADKLRSKSKDCDFLCLKEDATKPCDEFEKKIYKIVRDEDLFTALPVDNLESSQSLSKKKVSLKDQESEKKYKISKYAVTRYSPELYPGYYQNYPIVQIMRPGIPEMSAFQTIQQYWNDEAYPGRKSAPEIYNDYYSGTFETSPRFTRGQATELAPKKHVYDFGFGYQNEDSRKSPNPSYPDMMGYQPLTSRSHIRRRRQVNNEIFETTDKSINEIWSDSYQLRSGEDLQDLENNAKFIEDFGKSQNHPKKTEMGDFNDEFEWERMPTIHALHDDPVENSKGFKTENDDNNVSENGGMIISITVTDLTGSKDNPGSLVSNPDFDEQREPWMREHQIKGSDPSAEFDDFSDRHKFLPDVLNKMNSFLSFLRSWSPNFNF